jgi:hypothetical protein
MTTVTDPAAAVVGGPKNLDVTIAHVRPAPQVSFTFPTVVGATQMNPPFFYGRAMQQLVGPGNNRAVARLSIIGTRMGAPEPAARVILSGGIYPAGLSRFTGSLRDIGMTPLTGVTFTPDYRVPGMANPVNGGNIMAPDLAPGRRTEVDLARQDPAPPAGGTLASYTVRASGSPTSETELAFLGSVDGLSGMFNELDLDAAALAFVGFDEYLVPMLHNELQPLFVAVNLTQWLSNPTPFFGGENFDFVNGTSPDLPGILVSTTPITLDPDMGYVSAGAFTGEASVAGAIDGEVIGAPEPATFTLLGIGVVGCVGFGWIRRRPGVKQTA